MGKIMKNGVELSGSSNSAENIKYDETKNVKEAIDETSRKIDDKFISWTSDGVPTTGVNAKNGDEYARIQLMSNGDRPIFSNSDGIYQGLVLESDLYSNVMYDLITTSLDSISIITDSTCTLNNGTISATYALYAIARSKNYVRCLFNLSLPLTQECYTPGHTSAGYDIATINFSNLASYCGVSEVSLATFISGRIGVIDNWGGITCIGWVGIYKVSGNIYHISFTPEGSYINKQLSTITTHHVSICINTDVLFVLTN